MILKSLSKVYEVKNRVVLNSKSVHDYLKKHDISQTWLAKKMGISDQHLSQILSGKRPVPQWIQDGLEKILKIRDISHDEQEGEDGK